MHYSSPSPVIPCRPWSSSTYVRPSMYGPFSGFSHYPLLTQPRTALEGCVSPCRMCLLYGGRPLQTPCTASTVFRQGRGVSQGVLQRPLLRGPERVQVISSQAHSSLIQLQSDLSDLSLRAGRLDIPPAWPYELAVFGLAACAIVLWQCRPRGWSDSGLVAVKDSSIHGKGLFAVCLIPEGSVIGEYPGLLRNSAQVMEKVQLAPRAKGYLFRLTEYAGFDPTDAYGNVSSRPGAATPSYITPCLV